MTPPPGPGNPSVTNTASGNAHIGVQGIVNGDVRYEVSREDPPDKKFAVAKNCLAGNMPRRAEELIKEVVEVQFTSNEVAYYWTIAVLSDRSFDLLGPDEFADLHRAKALCAKNPADGWHTALLVVDQLVDRLLEQEQTGDLGPTGLHEFFVAHDRLPEDRKDEIRRHLDLILTGGIQDHLDAEFAEDVRGQRRGDDREARVWKFFEPVPERPRPKPLTEPTLDLLARTMAFGSAVMGGSGLLLGFALAIAGNLRMGILAALLVAVGGYAVARFGPAYLPARFSTPRPKATDFSRYVSQAVQREFAACAPEPTWERAAWATVTHEIKTALTNDIVDLYSEPEVAPGAVDWLIKWHAEEAARKWDADEFEYRDQVLPLVELALGGIALAAGSIIAFAEMTGVRLHTAGVALAWLAGGFLLMAGSRVDVHLYNRRLYPGRKIAGDRRLAAETRAFEAWSALLANRPTDDLMARWLDYDKIYLKTLAMNQYGLTNRDVIAHAILAEAAARVRSARTPNGPLRYSGYVVWVFLLTESGVRQVAIHLDFATGIASNQTRTTFRYDAITSARVTEIGIRFDGGQREIILPDAEDKQRKKKKSDAGTSAQILRQGFRLSLMDGQTVEIEVVNLDVALLDKAPGDGSRPSMPDTSDLAGALRILEAVAADGREWIAKARTRRRSRLRHDSRIPWPANDRPDGSPLEPTRW